MRACCVSLVIVLLKNAGRKNYANPEHFSRQLCNKHPQRPPLRGCRRILTGLCRIDFKGLFRGREP